MKKILLKLAVAVVYRAGFTVGYVGERIRRWREK